MGLKGKGGSATFPLERPGVEPEKMKAKPEFSTRCNAGALEQPVERSEDRLPQATRGEAPLPPKGVVAEGRRDTYCSLRAKRA
ncbi:MAG: hypothetical protein A4E53_00397 [Pelotomaculum sp. PtaB.Bin104]|nr:MAG: hypothetical protein A4E53_00397 [Pelotomaculum sp. PtaB.Bin104]